MVTRRGGGVAVKAAIAITIAVVSIPALAQPLRLLDADVIRQTTASDCGLAALASLLGAFKGYQVNLTDLSQRAANLDLLTDTHVKHGFSIRELVQIAATFDVVIEAKLVDINQLKMQRRPVIAWLSFEGNNNHFTVINPGLFDSAYLSLADPTLGRRKVNEEHFLSWWLRFEGRGVILTASDPKARSGSS